MLRRALPCTVCTGPEYRERNRGCQSLARDTTREPVFESMSQAKHKKGGRRIRSDDRHQHCHSMLLHASACYCTALSSLYAIENCFQPSQKN